MTRERRWLLGITAVLLSLGAGSNLRAQATTIRWDFQNITFPPPQFIADAGGQASALAVDGSKITLTGSGTFVVEEPDAVTGGGVWMIRGPLGDVAGLGTYHVTELLSYNEIPFQFPVGAFIDKIGKVEDVRLGLAFLRIAYSDGSRGILTIMCQDPGAMQPATAEGITVSKGFVNYWSRDGQRIPINENFTIFHVVR
jgi:hypothetical protein